MISRTHNAIVNAFLVLIKEHDFNKISVDMIMKKATVSRSTFYRYFKDKYDVMNATYKNLLDYYVAPERSRSYRDLCYHLFNRNEFENYLVKNTKFETASTSRHQFGSIYKENGKYYLKLNLQIRFIK